MKKFLLCFSMLSLWVFHGSAQIERILWSRYVTGSEGYSIFTMLPDGTDIISLSAAVNSYGGPRISPDGSKIAFNKSVDDIYVMNADGTNVVNLTRTSPNVYVGGPGWSPDGSKVVYTSSEHITSSIPYYFTDNSIWVINANGSNQRRLTPDGASSPAWSSTNKIAFVTNYGGYSHIHTMDPDGSNWQRITNGAASHGAPSWSPDGSKISYVSERNREIGMYIMNADGTGEVRLVPKDTTFEFGWGSATWSPDGNRLLFISKLTSGGPATDIYSINIDGTNLTRIAPVDDPFNRISDNSPNWMVIAIPPAAAAGTIPAVTSTTAFVNGIVSANGAPTAVFFQYSTDPSMAAGVIEVTATPDSLGAFNNNNKTASASLVNLAPNTTYYYRLKGVNSKGTTLGPIQSFITTVESIPLSVSLVSYEAQLLANNQVKLTWRTAQESDNSHFVIEKSTDGILFTPIGRVEGNGNSSTITDYTFTDVSFISANAYYRLKQVDRDGRSTESGIRKVSQNGAQNKARLYPNPVTNNFFTVETGTNLPVAYKILTVTGQQVQEGMLKKPKEQVNISAIPKGHYMLRLSDGNTMKFRKE